MTTSRARSSAKPKPLIDAELTIYQANEIHAKLVDALRATDELELDLSRVEEIDSAGMQVLIHLHELALQERKSLRMVHHSQPVIDVLGLFNLEAYFGDPLVLPAGANDKV